MEEIHKKIIDKFKKWLKGCGYTIKDVHYNIVKEYTLRLDGKKERIEKNVLIWHYAKYCNNRFDYCK